MPVRRRRLSPAGKRRILARQDQCCSACKKPFAEGDRIEFDHGWDLWLGGPDTEDNLFAKHAHCHLRKTKRQTTARAKLNRRAKRESGETKPCRQWPSRDINSRGFDRTRRKMGAAYKVGPSR